MFVYHHSKPIELLAEKFYYETIAFKLLSIYIYRQSSVKTPNKNIEENNLSFL